MVLKTVEPALLQDTLAFLECARISTGQQPPRVPRDSSLMRVIYVSVTSSNVFQAASQSVQPETDTTEPNICPQNLPGKSRT